MAAYKYAQKAKQSPGTAKAESALPRPETLSNSEMMQFARADAPRPMSPMLRAKFERGFDADFSNIRISRGYIPPEMGVKAMAQGNSILLDRSANMDVLGHELAHTVQQAQSRVPMGGHPVVENAGLEHEADLQGARVAAGLTADGGAMAPLGTGLSGFGGEHQTVVPMSGASAPASFGAVQFKKDKSKPTDVNQFNNDQALPENIRNKVSGITAVGPSATRSQWGESTSTTQDIAISKMLENVTPEMMDDPVFVSQLNRLVGGNMAQKMQIKGEGKTDQSQAFSSMLRGNDVGTLNAAKLVRMHTDKGGYGDRYRKAPRLGPQGAVADATGVMREQMTRDKGTRGLLSEIGKGFSTTKHLFTEDEQSYHQANFLGLRAVAPMMMGTDRGGQVTPTKEQKQASGAIQQELNKVTTPEMRTVTGIGKATGMTDVDRSGNPIEKYRDAMLDFTEKQYYAAGDDEMKKRFALMSIPKEFLPELKLRLGL